MSDAAKPILDCNRLVEKDDGKKDYCLRPATHRVWTGARWLHLCDHCADIVRQSTRKHQVTKIP